MASTAVGAEFLEITFFNIWYFSCIFKCRVDIKDIISSNGSILSFKFSHNNKVFDLCRFIMSSLEDACESYKIFNKKNEI